MKKELIEILENNLLNLKSEDCAISVTIKLLFTDQINISVIQNNEDSEILVISTIIKTLTDYYLLNNLNLFSMQYVIDVNRIDDCIEINFLISDKIN